MQALSSPTSSPYAGRFLTAADRATEVPAQDIQPAITCIEIREEDFLNNKGQVVVVPVRLLPQPDEGRPARTGCLASCLPSPGVATTVWGPLAAGAGLAAYGAAEDMPRLALGASLFSTTWFLLSTMVGVYRASRSGTV